MTESMKSTKPTQQTTTTIARTVEDLRAVGLTPREIYRLRVLRDCLGCYPHLEFFSNDEWRKLLFMKWRYEHGEYAGDMPPNAIVIHADISADLNQE